MIIWYEYVISRTYSVFLCIDEVMSIIVRIAVMPATGTYDIRK